MKLANSLKFNNLRGDLFGGVTAAVVALPLALAFGVSSGAGAITGLYGSIFIGFFAALFGGTPAQISGPTGPMTVVMATVFTGLVANNPDNGLAMAFTVVMLGGLFQILFGILKLGVYVTLMPYTVISGFMSGVGVIILLLQIGPLLGHPASANVLASLQNFPYFLQNLNPVATTLGVLTLLIVFFSPSKLNRIIPSPLSALIICTLVSVIFFSDSAIERIGEIPTGLPHFQLPVFDFKDLRTMISYGIMLAILGSIDSLLTSLVADNISRTQHDSDKELIGQGIGNFISGLFGGLPGAGATMRTVINVQAGGKTPLSGIIHAFILLVILLGAGRLTEAIPNAVLAGILIKVGIDIIDWGFLKRSHLISTRGTIIMYGVVFLTIFVDLITAVVVGVFVANLFTIKRLSDFQSDAVKVTNAPTEDVELSDEENHLLKKGGGKVFLFRLSGPMSFGAAKSITRRMVIIKNYEILILDVSDVYWLGVTASLAIETMVKDAYEQNRTIFIVVSNDAIKSRLSRLKILDLLPPQNQVAKRIDALEQALKIITSVQ